MDFVKVKVNNRTALPGLSSATRLSLFTEIHTILINTLRFTCLPWPWHPSLCPNCVKKMNKYKVRRKLYRDALKRTKLTINSINNCVNVPSEDESEDNPLCDSLVELSNVDAEVDANHYEPADLDSNGYDSDCSYVRDSNTSTSDLSDDTADIASDVIPAKHDALESNEPLKQCFQVLLAQWAINFQIPLIALNALLQLLHILDPTLPHDARTLLKTPRKCELKVVEPGKYYHFGVFNAVTKLIDKFFDTLSSVKINVNVDGLPISKSSGSQVYPILCNLEGNPQAVEMIGIYHGFEKPTDANMLLHDFVTESNSLISTGFKYKNITYPFRVNSFICDAPAKSFITFTKGHTGYSSCSKCYIEGAFSDNRVYFSETSNLRKRSDVEFRNRFDEDHHVGSSIIETLSHFDMVYDIPLDYMHLICLGVVRKLLMLWVNGKPKTKLAFNDISRISKFLISLRNNVPCEFVRKPRSLQDLKRFKATEFRQLLYYTGPLILKSILSIDRYTNFLCLHVSATILSNDFFLKHFGAYAESLLSYFVKTFVVLYGKEHASHNIHNLLHIYEDCKRFGILQNFSAFPFENHLQKLKSLVRKGTNPLAQIVKRTLEQNSFPNTPESGNIVDKVRPLMKHSNGPVLGNHLMTQYRCIQFPNFALKLTEADCCCGLKDKSVVCIENIVCDANNDLSIIGRKFNSCKDLYLDPCPSSTFDIYIIS
ncbi:hypothetical protein PPYR_15436, partial [Photinus pyralis]